MLLKFAIKDFIEDRDFKNLSPVTIKGYNATLLQFYEFSSSKDIIDTCDVTPSTIKSFLIYCQKQRKNNPTSINHKLHDIKIFFNYLEGIGVISPGHNPAKKIPFIKEDILIKVFTDEQVKQMLDYYRRIKSRDKVFWAYRDYTIILTLLSTGMRLGELSNLRWDEIDIKNETITVMGKKRQQSSLPMADKLKKELCEYRIFCEQSFGKLSDHVFVNINNEPLTQDAIKCIFKRLKKVMNFKDVRVSAHTFRHYFAAKMIMSGCDVFTVQKMLRHSNLKMTQRYVDLFGTALKEQNDKYNPLNKLNL